MVVEVSLEEHRDCETVCCQLLLSVKKRMYLPHGLEEDGPSWRVSVA